MANKIKAEFRLVCNNDGLFYLFGTGIEKCTVLNWLLAKPAEPFHNEAAFHLPAWLVNRFLLESSFPYDELNDPVALARHFMNWLSRYEGSGATRSSWDDDGVLWIDWWPAWLNPDLYEPVVSRYEDFR